MKLGFQQYGKARVRVVKVTRGQKRHEIKEVEVSVMLEGDFAESYRSGDNRKVIPTDTMKNTVNALAKEHLGGEIEEFGLALGRHFLKRHSHLTRASIRLNERLWQRMSVKGRPHRHSFLGTRREKPFAEVVCTRRGATVKSGIEDLLILKTTGSGFENFVRDEYTTLRDTTDRILATNAKATWLYRKTPRSYAATNRKILQAMLAVFAERYSPSVQTTLYQMGAAGLKAAPEISEVTLKLPNQHCLLIDLSPFGLENKNEIFVPTEEPHGLIEATVTR